MRKENEYNMFNLTTKAQDFYLNILKVFSSNDDATDNGVKSYCQSEYGKDWYWAYNSYKIDGRFPNPLQRKI